MKNKIIALILTFLVTLIVWLIIFSYDYLIGTSDLPDWVKFALLN